LCFEFFTGPLNPLDYKSASRDHCLVVFLISNWRLTAEKPFSRMDPSGIPGCSMKKPIQSERIGPDRQDIETRMKVAMEQAYLARSERWQDEIEPFPSANVPLFKPFLPRHFILVQRIVIFV
jgi:hypothetical protein